MKKDVDGTINNIKGVGDYLDKFATDDKVRDQAMKSMGQAWDNMVEGFKKDPAYSLGGATFEVASWFVGAGEVKAGVSAAKTTQGIVRGINAFGKTVGKAAVKNASAMAKNIAHLATRGPGLSKSIGKAAMVKMKKVNKAFSNALDHISSKFDEAYAYAEGFFSKDFTKHKARVYQSSGGDWDRVVRETFGDYEDPFRKQILNNIEESKRAREASNFSDYLKKEKEVLERVEFGEAKGRELIPRELTRQEKKLYKRPSGYRKGMRETVWETAKNEDGVVIDPLTNKVMDQNKPWDMGHKPGYEFWKHQQSAAERGITRKEFLDEYHNVDHFRPELPSSNRSHKDELASNLYYGP